MARVTGEFGKPSQKAMPRMMDHESLRNALHAYDGEARRPTTYMRHIRMENAGRALADAVRAYFGIEEGT